MKILAVSNLYPPHFIGGYELGCRDVLEGLRVRGHEVRVLTSTYGVPAAVREGHVWRVLRHDIATGATGLGAVLRKDFFNRRLLREAVREFAPDVIYLWNLGGISLSLAFEAQRTQRPVSYLISDSWLVDWEDVRRPSPRGPRRILRALLALGGWLPPAASLDLRGAHFVSDFLRREAMAAGKRAENSAVIPWGIDIARFAFRPREGAPRRLLYVGQIAPHKGVATAIKALAKVRDDISLTLAGRAASVEYESVLRDLAAGLGVAARVEFRGMVPRDELPAVYAAHDVLIFPSLWAEPFSIALLEGMASGLAVVGTTTGGSAEILRDSENALTFAAGDAGACAAQLQRLVGEPQLAARLGAAARRTVAENYTLPGMIDRIEGALCRAAQSP